ncbi:MAG: CPCC family cysteine-rich protein [Butyricicoccus sp.]
MNTREIDKIRCPVCGKTLLAEYDICDVCNWENDLLQLANPKLRGANRMTIEEAKTAYRSGKTVE